MIEDRGQIAWNYMTGWLPIDVLAILPFELMFNFEGVNGMVRVIRMGKLGKLIRVTKIFKVLKVI